MKVTLEHLTKQFPNMDKKIKTLNTAVGDMNLDIPDGKLIALLGPSGCGKSTTLYMISGLLEPSSGHIYFGDDDVTELPPEKRGIGLVFQNYALYPHLTVRENIQFPLDNLKGKNKLSKEEKEARVLEAAKLVQIEMLLDRRPGEMSGGQQQRVAIARALVKKPRVLLLDEPLSNLDARLRLQTREEIRRIQLETGITTLFVTHDQEEAMSISDFIVVMKKAYVQQVGKPQDVYDHPCNLFVAKFLGTPAINTFNGYVKNNQIFIGDEAILDVKDVADQEVTVAIRPEGFILDYNGRLTCEFESLEVMGRDVSIVSHHKENLGNKIRSIVPSTTNINTGIGTVKFNLDPRKVFIFGKDENETNIDFEVVNQEVDA